MSAAEWLAQLAPLLRAYVANRVPTQDSEDVMQETLVALAGMSIETATDEERRKLGFTVARRRVADVDLVLSGHTHLLYLERGRTLDGQLVVGSLAQRDAHRNRPARNQLQVLRIEVTDRGRFPVSRHVAERSGGTAGVHVATGPFEWVRSAAGGIHVDQVEI